MTVYHATEIIKKSSMLGRVCVAGSCLRSGELM